jgi:tetratricopeptide (TPR) repeat protein|tara:strand:+ start:442 stop:2283 length:1842 start_codon:yes stop_codon:yes gene_type:complete
VIVLATSPTNSSSKELEQTELLQRQAKAVERIAQHLAPEAEEKRSARLRRVLTWVATRTLLLGGLLVGTWESAQWLYQTWETRSAAQDYAIVASDLFYKENNPEVAQKLLEEAIELDSDNFDFRFLQAYIVGMASVRTLLNLDRPYTKEELDLAHEALAKALFLERQSPGKPESEILRGQIYAALSDYQRARESILRGIQKIPESNLHETEETGPLREKFNASVLFILDLVGGAKLKAFTVDLFKIPQEDSPQNANFAFAYIRLALIENQLTGVDSAYRYLDKALTYEPNSKWAFLWRGVFQGQEKKWTAAREQYDRAIAVDPRFDLAYYNKGWTYLKDTEKNYGAARDMFQKALSINPNYKEAYYGLGMVYGYQNKYQVSKRYLTRAISIDDKFLSGWKWRGIVNDELGLLDDALTDFSTAISLDPANEDLYVRRARVLKKRKQYQESLEDLLLAKDFNASNYRIPFYTGQVFAELGQTANAIEEFGNALELRPNYGEALIGRAAVYEAMQNTELAMLDYNEAVRHVTYRRERVLHKRGEFLARQSDYNSALADFRLARELNPRYARSWLAEAQTLNKLGDSEGAYSAINEYLKLRPQSEEAQALKESLPKQ